MMHDELIEAAARAIKDSVAYSSFWPNSDYETMARAAISVIAPAVLREALGAMTELEIAAQDEGLRDYVSAFRDANGAVRKVLMKGEG